MQTAQFIDVYFDLDIIIIPTNEFVGGLERQIGYLHSRREMDKNGRQQTKDVKELTHTSTFQSYNLRTESTEQPIRALRSSPTAYAARTMNGGWVH